jgi:hypothetical protein
MKGEKDLDTLLKGMQPKLQSGVYVFCCLAGASMPLTVQPVCLFQEEEGLTAILRKETAESLRLENSFPCAWISLTIHSDLEAVGLLAAITHKLAAAGISCNIVSAYYHDHLFVPQGEAQRALDLLQELARMA